MGAKPTAYLSGYFTSKLAQAKMIEYLTVENPSLFAVAVHPGMVDTAMLKRSGADPKSLPMDDGTQDPVLLVPFLFGYALFKADTFSTAAHVNSEPTCRLPRLPCTKQPI